MSVRPFREVPTAEVPTRPAQGRDAGIFDFDWDATSASAEDAYHDAPGRDHQLRQDEIAGAAAELAKLNGRNPLEYHVLLPGEPEGNVPIIDEGRFWGDLARLRQSRPDALADLGKDRADYEAKRVARSQAGAAERGQRMAKGGLLGNLAGSMVGGFTDPINLMTLPAGSMATSVARRIVTNGLINLGVEVAEQPFVSLERDAQGREMTLEERAMRVGSAFLGGAAFSAAGEAAPYVARGIGALDAKGYALAAPIRAQIDPLFRDRDMARAFASAVPADAMSPAEAAALHVLTRQAEVDASSPFEHSYEALDAHAAKIDQVMREMGGEAPVSLAGAPRAAGFDMAAYMSRNRGAESGGSDAAAAATSSAYGRYQFLQKTWLDSYRSTFGETGESRAAILAKRADGAVQDRVMATFTAANVAQLRRAGVPVDDASVYLAHFLGAGDAIKVLKAAAGTPVGNLVSAASIKANAAVFARAGSAGELIDWAHGKMGGAPGERLAAGADMRPDAPDAARPLVDLPDRGAEPLVLRRDLFPGDETSWRIAQSAREAEELGLKEPLVTRQSVWEEARDRLVEEKAGEVPGALYHADVGPIDVKWGNEKGGLAHIVAEHADVLDRLPALLDTLEVVRGRSSANRLHLESPDHVAKVRLDWDGEDQRWLLTAFRKDEKAPPATEDGGVAGDARDHSPSAGAGDDIGAAASAGKTGWVARDGEGRVLGRSASRAEAAALARGTPGGRVEISARAPDLPPALRDELVAARQLPPAFDEAALKAFDDPAGEGVRAATDTAWHDIEASGPDALQRVVDLDDGKGPRTVADIRDELAADARDIDTIEACLKPMGGGA